MTACQLHEDVPSSVCRSCTAFRVQGFCDPEQAPAYLAIRLETCLSIRSLEQAISLAELCKKVKWKIHTLINTPKEHEGLTLSLL
jgi:hypothetical protein